MIINSTNNFLYEKETYKIIGSAQEVHKELGPGFLEMVYHDALEIEFKKMRVPYKREFPIPVYYKNEKICENL
jgi:GxxExxY protein